MRVELPDHHPHRASQRVNGTGARIKTVWLPGLALAAMLVSTLVVVELVFPSGIRNAIRGAAIDAGYGRMGGEARLRSELAKLPGRLYSNLMNPPDIPRLVIDISFKNLTDLHAKRAEALKLGYLVQEEDDFVPASIRIGERTVAVKLRLKGDMVDHVRTSKWSFRVHTKGDEHVLGMRRFSLQHPETRGFQAEVLFLETLRRLDVLAPRYRFVDVVVNGNRVGLMALEEHFSTELLESNRRRDGIILRFDESLMWADRVARGRDGMRSRGPFDSIYNAPIDAFRSSSIRKSDRLQRQFVVAAGLLRAYVEGDVAAEQVFDVDKMGRFLAAAELWGVWHALDWNNQRFYFNPLSMRLEPIGYDGDLGGGIGSGSINTPGSLAGRMLDDPAIYAAFERHVRRLKAEVQSGELIEFFQRLQADALRQLRTEFALLNGIDLSRLRARAEELPYPTTIPETPGPFGAFVIAQTIEADGRTYLELSNPLREEVEVVGVEWRAPDGSTLDFAAVQSLEFPLRLPPKPEHQKRVPLLVEYRPLTGAHEVWLEVSSRLRGQSEIKTIRARPGALPLDQNPRPEGDLEGAMAANPFMSLSADGKKVEVSPGRWFVSGSLIIPDPFELRIEAGTTLYFEPGASLIAYGPTRFIGTSRDPVILDVAPGQAAAAWQGLVVYEAGGRSVWEHVVVANTSGVRWAAWELTGGVTFYRSDVSMAGCRLAGNLAEDALNIIHSDFDLEDIEIVDTASDGFDSDFSTGSIRGGVFSGIGAKLGADGVDVSGSEVTIEGTRFARVTDKAISVGENSRLTASDVQVEECGAGAVSKDGSNLVIRNSVIRGATIAGLMSYMKKPVYGGASLIAESVQIGDTQVPTWAQHGNSLLLDGRSTATEDIDVDALYRSSMRRGASR